MPQVNDFSWFNLSMFCCVMLMCMIISMFYVYFGAIQFKYPSLKVFYHKYLL